MNVEVASTMTLTARRTVFFISSPLYDSRASIQANSKFIKAGPSQAKSLFNRLWRPLGQKKFFLGIRCARAKSKVDSISPVFPKIADHEGDHTTTFVFPKENAWR